MDMPVSQFWGSVISLVGGKVWNWIPIDSSLPLFVSESFYKIFFSQFIETRGTESFGPLAL